MSDEFTDEFMEANFGDTLCRQIGTEAQYCLRRRSVRDCAQLVSAYKLCKESWGEILTERKRRCVNPLVPPADERNDLLIQCMKKRMGEMKLKKNI